jgi:hypothetical protein
MLHLMNKHTSALFFDMDVFKNPTRPLSVMIFPVKRVRVFVPAGAK